MDIEKTLPLAAGIASAFVSNHHVAPGDIPRLLAETHAAVIAEANGKSAYGSAAEPDKPTPRTPSEIKKSITHDKLISFEDGKPYRMTAPGYSEARSKLAKAIGLGQRPTA
jgi:predicted transcriptional regulator